MLLEGALEHERSRRGIAARGEEQRPASRRGRERPRTPGRLCLVLELPQQLGGAIKVAHADLRLDRVGVDGDDARLVDAHLAQEPNHGFEVLVGLGEAPQRQLQEPEHRAVAVRVEAVPALRTMPALESRAARAELTSPRSASTSAWG